MRRARDDVAAGAGIMIELPWLGILGTVYVAWLVGASGSLLLRRRSPASTLAWIFAFAALPILSGLYYWVFGPRRLTRRRRRYDLVRGAIAGEVSEYLRSSRHPEAVLPPHVRALATVGERLGQGGPRYAESVRLLCDGDTCIDALAEAIAAAHHHVHMEYYIWEPDGVGTRFRDLLVDARRRGVEVRVVHDSLGSPRAKSAFWAPLRDAGGEVRAFNPFHFTLARLRLANFRTHRKMVICDGSVGFLGGMNLHDPESRTHSGDDAWRDEHLRIAGEPVRRLQRLFLEQWTFSGGAFPLTPESARRFFPTFSESAAGPPVQLLASGPDDERAPIHAFFLAALSTARRRVWIETPYLVPDEPLESALVVARLRGVDVQIIVPKRGDSKLVTSASHTYCEALKRSGIAIHEYGPPMLHAKTMIVDDSVAVVGTANLDNRSFRLNFEAAAVLFDPPSVRELAKRFERDRTIARPFPARPRGRRVTVLLESLARLTSPVL